MTIGEIARDIADRAGELATRLVLFVLLAVIVMAAGRALRPLVRRRLARRGRPSFTLVFTALYSTVVAVLGLLLAATLAFPSVRMVDVLGGLGIVSVAVGFAFKDVLENLLAGVLLLLRDPFKSGDQIRVGGHEGTVEGVTVRETLLRTHDGQRVLLPNAQVYTSALEVLTHNPWARVAFAVRLDATADLDAARSVAAAAMARTPGVADDPAAELIVTGTAPGEVLAECRLWTGSSRAARTAALDAAVPAVLRALAGAGVPVADGALVLRDEGEASSATGATDGPAPGNG